MATPILIFFIVLIALTLFVSLTSVQQGSIAVTTVFGKYRRMLTPGLSFKIPFVEVIYKRISI